MEKVIILRKTDKKNSSKQFKNDLDIITNSWRKKPTNNVQLGQNLYVLAQQLYEDHNCDAYFITLTMTQNDTIINQWVQLKSILKDLQQGLNERHLIAGALIAIEMHKKASKANKGKGADNSAGYPHIHIVLWIYHQFLNQTINHIRAFFVHKGFDTNVQKLKDTLDVKKTILYTVKESADTNLINICKQTLQQNYSAFIWTNHTQCKHIFEQIANVLRNSGKEYVIGVQNVDQIILPTIIRSTDPKLMLAMLFRRVFEIEKLAIFDNYVYTPIPGAKFTWQRWLTLETWIADWYKHNFPPQFLTMLQNSALWLNTQGAIHKKAPQLKVFPELQIETQLIEFQDGVYDFTHALLRTEKHPLSPFAGCTNFHPVNFHEIKPPLHILGLLFTLLTNPQHEDIPLWYANQSMEQLKDNMVLIAEQWAKPRPQDPTTYNKEQQHQQIQSEIKKQIQWESRQLNKLLQLLNLIAGIFHPEIHRKENPVLFLVGKPSSYKTLLVHYILNATLGEHQIKVMPRNNGNFNFGFLAENNKVTILIDDVQWDQLGLQAGEFINLLDRNQVLAEQKYRDPKQVKHEGSLVITGNIPIDHSNDSFNNGLSKSHQHALETRIHTVELYKHEEAYRPNEEQLNYIKQQSINLSILANTIYLNKHEIQKSQQSGGLRWTAKQECEKHLIGHLPDNWRNTNWIKHVDQQDIFETLGARIFRRFQQSLIS